MKRNISLSKTHDMVPLPRYISNLSPNIKPWKVKYYCRPHSNDRSSSLDYKIQTCTSINNKYKFRLNHIYFYLSFGSSNLDSWNYTWRYHISNIYIISQKLYRLIKYHWSIDCWENSLTMKKQITILHELDAINFLRGFTLVRIYAHLHV